MIDQVPMFKMILHFVSVYLFIVLYYYKRIFCQFYEYKHNDQQANDNNKEVYRVKHITMQVLIQRKGLKQFTYIETHCKISDGFKTIYRLKHVTESYGFKTDT